jgi:hypothetical protein
MGTNMPMATQNCAHDACLCTKPYPPQAQALSTQRINPNGEYCSKRCAEQEGGASGDDGCECGHPQCDAMTTRDIPPMQ